MKSYQLFKFFCILFVLLAFSTEITAQNLEKEVDTFLSSEYPSDAPGVIVLIAKEGQPIYRKAFGMADLELKVPMQPSNVIEIGSITKQFTVVAILMLEEQGKLKIEDAITKYIPEYPTQGKTITIHQLLNHTSGIRSYTDMPSFQKMARTDMTPTEIIDAFKNEPMDFDPGEKFLYNNSGYILLGHIIEVVSGQTYADFIQKNIFDVVGMTDSYYGSMKTLIPNRASGYSRNENGYSNADYLSLTLPYAAGAIMSTIDDMLKWQNALSANSLVKKTSMEKAIHGSSLNNGEPINYGYGLEEADINGSRSIQHGGGIFGYTTMGIFLPEEDMYVIALSNCDCGNVNAAALKIAAMAIGKPFPDKKDAIALSEAQLKKWVSVYQFEDEVIRYVTFENGKLFSQREGSSILEIYPMAENNFIFDGGNTSYEFSMKDGKKEAKFTSGKTIAIGKEIDKVNPSVKTTINLASEVLAQYVGKYELQPGFIMDITTKDQQIFAQLTGQPQLEIFAEKEDTFFLKVVEAQLVFDKNDEGKVKSLTLHQGGQQLPAKKIE
ncbi:CubicO group peptidase (beta-lactamase class C family) [Gelidibacter algens]|uniref:CubicO group peptidase (Beta-lactamase class C family) n=1 Tax=Gelidibacter algens TaxID=49280 RepID=A0A1A7R713_9FLAO|nr:serine hydrolase [Gelidibacter algens]OBX27293.1 serine hydrolase [Gelidibacter algens]RAJ20941.1 CubicO group peptidase (beta-lactamase class C family) [Gelidibacter algens]